MPWLSLIIALVASKGVSDTPLTLPQVGESHQFQVRDSAPRELGRSGQATLTIVSGVDALACDRSPVGFETVPQDDE